LIGKDAIVLGMACRSPNSAKACCPGRCSGRGLVFDEYDAGRPDVMFVIQRVLEVSGRLTCWTRTR
jgi:cobaltochelatase CobS